jgi:hypothetical protein
MAVVNDSAGAAMAIRKTKSAAPRHGDAVIILVMMIAYRRPRGFPVRLSVVCTS